MSKPANPEEFALVVLGVVMLLPMWFGGREANRVSSDLEGLHPAFRVPLERALARLTAQGIAYHVQETVRSEQRARALRLRGTGIVRSLHRLGLAADVLPARNSWTAGSDPFWAALRDAVEAEGLTSGASFSRVDRPHVQLFPASRDREMWALYSAGTLDTVLA